MGSCIDLSVVDMDELSPNQRVFFDPSVTVHAIDNWAGEYAFFPELVEVYQRGLIAALNSGSEDAAAAILEQLHYDLNRAIEIAVNR